MHQITLLQTVYHLRRQRLAVLTGDPTYSQFVTAKGTNLKYNAIFVFFIDDFFLTSNFYRPHTQQNKYLGSIVNIN